MSPDTSSSPRLGGGLFMDDDPLSPAYPAPGQSGSDPRSYSADRPMTGWSSAFHHKTILFCQPAQQHADGSTMHRAAPPTRDQPRARSPITPDRRSAAPRRRRTGDPARPLAAAANRVFARANALCLMFWVEGCRVLPTRWTIHLICSARHRSRRQPHRIRCRSEQTRRRREQTGWRGEPTTSA